MKAKGAAYRMILTAMAIVMLIGCLFTLCGCHVFPWYVPKPYSDKKMAEIYSYINDELLAGLNSYISSYSYVDPTDGREKWVNIFVDDGKLIISWECYDFDTRIGNAVYYEGVLKQYDVIENAETQREADISEFEFLFENVRKYADYLTTVVGSDYEDGYCWECFPWRIGMAQIYYDVDCDEIGAQEGSISASWTVQKSTKLNPKPLVSDASFRFSSDIGYIWLELYAEPYNLDERIPNILKNYESWKDASNEGDTPVGEAV